MGVPPVPPPDDGAETLSQIIDDAIGNSGPSDEDATFGITGLTYALTRHVANVVHRMLRARDEVIAGRVGDLAGRVSELERRQPVVFQGPVRLEGPIESNGPVRVTGNIVGPTSDRSPLWDRNRDRIIRWILWGAFIGAVIGFAGGLLLNTFVDGSTAHVTGSGRVVIVTGPFDILEVQAAITATLTVLWGVLGGAVGGFFGWLRSR